MNHRLLRAAVVCLLTMTRPLFAADAPRRIAIIDVHTHPEYAEKPDARRDYLKQWDEAGLIAAVGILHTHHGVVPDFGERDILYCAGLQGHIDPAALEAGLRNHTYGCIKIYLGYEPYWAYDARYAPVYALAEKYDVPVIFHTGDTDRATALLKYADPLTIDEVAVAHPKVRMVIAHSGNPWIESAAEVAYKNPNVYLDGSAFLTGDLRKLPKQQVDTYMVRPLAWIFGYIENPKKLMFGSDWPIMNIPSAVEAFQRAIPEKYWTEVFCTNAVTVFKLHPRKPCRSK
jgi:predicted TIM-barrel fold metal-dependent hydrolase